MGVFEGGLYGIVMCQGPLPSTNLLSPNSTARAPEFFQTEIGNPNSWHGSGERGSDSKELIFKAWFFLDSSQHAQ